MGTITDHVPNPDQTLDRPGMSDEELFLTMRRLVMSNQIDHYRFIKTTARDLLVWAAVIAAGAGFVLTFWLWLPKVLG